MKASFLKPGISVPSRAGSQIQAGIPRQSRRRKSLVIAYETGQGEGAEPRRARWEPRDWREQLERIREMRRSRDAPVDEMGVQKCYDSSAPPQVTAFPQGTAFPQVAASCSQLQQAQENTASLIVMLPLDLSHLGCFQDRNWIRTLG